MDIPFVLIKNVPIVLMILFTEVLYAVNGQNFYDNKATVQGFTVDLEGNLLNTWNAADKVLL